MFNIKEIKENKSNFLELTNADKTTKAIINLNEGGRLQELQFNATPIIKEFSSFKYKNSYASSVLFPFANRIENGEYYFSEKKYNFPCNADGGKNALHGLVFNKVFLIKEKVVDANNCSVTIFLNEVQQVKSFPFTYKIYLTYTLFKDNLSLSVKINNTDLKSFPFVLGWHPYFFSEDLQKSWLEFKSNKKIDFDKNLITKQITDYNQGAIFRIENKQLDDCFILKENTVEFKTPNYKIEISSTSKENYLQMFTPNNFPIIAIEPMTGVSNSFNNKIGLQILEPNKNYSVTWNIKMKTLKTK